MGQDFNYAEIASTLGDAAAQRGFQATGAYYPNMYVAVGGTVAHSRKIVPPDPGSWVVGDEILENRDADRNIAQMLDGHLHRLLERTLKIHEHFVFPRTTSPEEHFKKMVKMGRRMDTWGRFHSTVPEEERWKNVEDYFPLNEDGTPVPLAEDFFEKRYRYLDYLLSSKILIPIAKRCIEGMVTNEEIESYGKTSGIAKINVTHTKSDKPSDASIELQDDFDLKRSSFIRRLLRYTFPEHVAYKYDALKDGEDPSKILSIPATWVVAANSTGSVSKIHTWDHAAVYLSGHELLPDTLEKLRKFSKHGEEQGQRIPWFISHLASSPSILSLGMQPQHPDDAEKEKQKKEASSKKRASSRNPPTPPAPKREAAAAQDRDPTGASKGGRCQRSQSSIASGGINPSAQGQRWQPIQGQGCNQQGEGEQV